MHVRGVQKQVLPLQIRIRLARAVYTIIVYLPRRLYGIKNDDGIIVYKYLFIFIRRFHRDNVKFREARPLPENFSCEIFLVQTPHELV